MGLLRGNLSSETTQTRTGEDELEEHHLVSSQPEAHESGEKGREGVVFSRVLRSLYENKEKRGEGEGEREGGGGGGKKGEEEEKRAGWRG